jgi:hypothetical protein
MKIKLGIVVIAVLFTGTFAHAISEKYRQQLEHSGCTQMSELQGCDVTKTKLQNAKAGFVSSEQLNKPSSSAVTTKMTQAIWPPTIPVVGNGFPAAGDACQKVGESAATVNYLDHTAVLVGCLLANDAKKLVGKIVGVVDGVTLVSVPVSIAGDGDSQGDAKVSGTKYHATAKIRCSGYHDAPSGMCDAGVVRGTQTGTYIDVTLPHGLKRTIFFNNNGSFLSFSTAQADGTAAMKIRAYRKNDTTIAILGTERYEIPDVFVSGD